MITFFTSVFLYNIYILWILRSYLCYESWRSSFIEKFRSPRISELEDRSIWRMIPFYFPQKHRQLSRDVWLLGSTSLPLRFIHRLSNCKKSVGFRSNFVVTKLREFHGSSTKSVAAQYFLQALRIFGFYSRRYCLRNFIIRVKVRWRFIDLYESFGD